MTRITIITQDPAALVWHDVIVSGSPWKVEVMAGPVGGGGGEPTRLIPARVPAVFEISTSPGSATFTKNDVSFNVTKPY